ncbi:MAG: hydantoinase/oxoprolinase family protein [Gammaproteobacteria bacterium]|nr:hydantoinase/oxoprolinase family protein [Gammaproteobacteria bacterium]
MSSPAQVAVDVGGTFTDVVAVRDGRIETVKVPTDLGDSARGVLAGLAEIGIADAAVFNHASTAGLNAVLTRRLPKVALLCTAGHRDILDIGRNWRPAEAVSDPRWQRSFSDVARPLVPRYLRRGVPERLHADGRVFRPLDEARARAELAVLRRCGVEGVAIALLHAYVDPVHERRLRELVAEELGAVPCAISGEVSPLAGEYPRTVTTVIDVMMRIIYGDYTARLGAGLAALGFRGRWHYADCAAMLAPVETAMARPSRIIFSGPAAGTTACAHFGELIGERQLICADVGGTSTDVSMVLDGRPVVDTRVELEHDLPVSTLSNAITSVGAGGGSLVTAGRAGEIRVGPESAGAEPGPACYDAGGTAPTLTDACLLIGILDAARFMGGRRRLSRPRAHAAFAALDTPLDLSHRVQSAFDTGLANIAEGILDIVIGNGIDPRDFVLVCYGAAGPMLLPAVLPLVQARAAIVPPHPGLFSALGLLSADRVFMESRSRYLALAPQSAGDIAAIYAGLEQAVRAQLGDDAEHAALLRSFDARMVGQAYETPFIDAPDGAIDATAIAAMVARFHDTYARRTGNRFEQVPVQAVTFRVRAAVGVDRAEFAALPARTRGAPTAARRVTLEHLAGGPWLAGEYERADLAAGDVIAGPAVVREALSTTYLPPGHRLTVGSLGELVITAERGT